MVTCFKQLSFQWDTYVEHGEYAFYSVFILFRHLALHDFYHAYRIEERRSNKAWLGENAL